ncbi:MAG: lysostaphin resistance A-like protein [Candidatus Binatia bacterium]
MNLLLLLLLVLCSLLILWAVQSLLLWLHKEPFALPLRFQTERLNVRYPMRLMVNLFWANIIIGYPLLVGPGPVAYFQAAFAPAPPWGTMTLMVFLVLAGFALGNLSGFLSGGIKVAPRYSTLRTTRKVLGCVLMSVPLALFEEAVFRGVALPALLSALPQSSFGTVVAIVISSALFASVHAIRKHRPEKAVIQPAIGLFFVGITLGTAYVTSGQKLWLPIAMHAAGILGVEIMRPFVVYGRRHPLLVGHRSTPHSSILGISIMLGLCFLLVLIHR